MVTGTLKHHLCLIVPKLIVTRTLSFKEAQVHFIFNLINNQFVLRLRISNFAQKNCSSHR